MKKYETPVIEIEDISDSDVLTASYTPGENEGEPDIF